LLTRGTAGAIDARDLFRRYFVFRDIPPGEPDENRIAAATPTATSHQMCQISAKPVMVAKKAVMNPTGLLRGTSIAL
jgi:hypothetical protein